MSDDISELVREARQRGGEFDLKVADALERLHEEVRHLRMENARLRDEMSIITNMGE